MALFIPSSKEKKKEIADKKARDVMMQDMIRRAAKEREEREKVEGEKKQEARGVINQVQDKSVKAKRLGALPLEKKKLEEDFPFRTDRPISIKSQCELLIKNYSKKY